MFPFSFSAMGARRDLFPASHSFGYEDSVDVLLKCFISFCNLNDVNHPHDPYTDMYYHKVL